MAYSRVSLRHLHHVFLFISALYTSVYAAESDSTSRLQVTMGGYLSVNMEINSNGDLAYESLPSVDIASARILNNDHATCFFWRSSHVDASVSGPFNERYPLQPFPSFESADRIYCYDNAVEPDLTFTLFLTYADGQHKMVRLTIDEEGNGDRSNMSNEYVEVQIGQGTEIGDPIGAALVGVPKRDIDGMRGFGGLPLCQFLARDDSGRYPIVVFANAYAPTQMYEDEIYESVVCFRNHVDDEARAHWLEGRNSP